MTSAIDLHHQESRQVVQFQTHFFQPVPLYLELLLDQPNLVIPAIPWLHLDRASLVHRHCPVLRFLLADQQDQFVLELPRHLVHLSRLLDLEHRQNHQFRLDQAHLEDPGLLLVLLVRQYLEVLQHRLGLLDQYLPYHLVDLEVLHPRALP